MTPNKESEIYPAITPISSGQQGERTDQRGVEENTSDPQMTEDAAEQRDHSEARGMNQPCPQALLDHLASWLKSQGIEPAEPRDELARIRKILTTLPEGLKPSMMANPK